MKKVWNNPTISVIGIEKTKAGNGPISVPDETYTEDNETWYSFPDQLS